MFAEIGLLVLEGDAAGLAAKVSELSLERREGPKDGTREHGDSAGGGTGAGESNGAHAEATRRDSPAPLVHSPHS